VVPFVPKIDTTKTSVKDKSIPHFQEWKIKAKTTKGMATTTTTNKINCGSNVGM
jgi:hypothetical protein